MRATHKKRIISYLQSGRSMVEMLGVLAVIGILSIGGISGLNYAMQLHRENATVNSFTVAIQGAKTARLTEAWCRKEGKTTPCNVKPELVVSVPEQNYLHKDKGDNANEDFFLTDTRSPVQIRIEKENGFTVRIAGISREVCEQIKAGKYGETCAYSSKVPVFNYNTCMKAKLESMECDKDFANQQVVENENEDEEQGTGTYSRRSALQRAEEYEVRTHAFDVTSRNYNALILFFATSSVKDIVESPLDCTERGGTYLNGHCCKDGYDIDTGASCETNTPPPLNPKTCSDYPGADYYNGKCCYYNGDSTVMIHDPDCCNDIFLFSDPTNPDPLCCTETPGYIYKNGTCCLKDEEQDYTHSYNPNCGITHDECSTKSCSSGGTAQLINGVCCCGVNDPAGHPNPVCCQNEGENVYLNGLCCTSELDGHEWDGNPNPLCKKNNEECTGTCSDGTAPVKDPASGACCCGTKKLGEGNSSQDCCMAAGFTWANDACCDGAKEEGTANVINVCCKAAGFTWSNGTCCKGNGEDFEGQTNTECKVCPNGSIPVEKNGTLCCGSTSYEEGEEVEACCDKTWMCDENDSTLCICADPGDPGYWIGCVPNSPYYGKSSMKDLSKAKMQSSCCSKAGGIWVDFKKAELHEGACCVKKSNPVWSEIDSSITPFSASFVQHENGTFTHLLMDNAPAGTQCCARDIKDTDSDRYFDILPYWAGDNPENLSPECCKVTNVSKTINETQRTYNRYHWENKTGSSGNGYCCINDTPFTYDNITDQRQECCNANSDTVWHTSTCCKKGDFKNWADNVAKDCCESYSVNGKNAVFVENASGTERACCDPDTNVDLEKGKITRLCCQNAGNTWIGYDETGMCCPTKDNKCKHLAARTLPSGQKMKEACCLDDSSCDEDGNKGERICACCPAGTEVCVP